MLGWSQAELGLYTTHPPTYVVTFLAVHRMYRLCIYMYMYTHIIWTCKYMHMGINKKIAHASTYNYCLNYVCLWLLSVKWCRRMICEAVVYSWRGAATGSLKSCILRNEQAPVDGVFTYSWHALLFHLPSI